MRLNDGENIRSAVGVLVWVMLCPLIAIFQDFFPKKEKGRPLYRVGLTYIIPNEQIPVYEIFRDYGMSPPVGLSVSF